MRKIAEQNQQASESVITPEEIRVLLQGERRKHNIGAPDGVERRAA